MFTPTTFGIAMLMMITSAVCWGSWANTYKLTKGYRFELFYWDYAIGIVLISLVLALTMGSTGGPDSFLDNVARPTRSNIALALVGGFIFNIANLLLVAAIEMAGLAIAFPLAIGIALVEGVVLSYMLAAEGRSGAARRSASAWRFWRSSRTARPTAASPAAKSAVSRKSIIICIVSGLLMGAFAPFVTRA